MIIKKFANVKGSLLNLIRPKFDELTEVTSDNNSRKDINSLEKVLKETENEAKESNIQ